MAGIVMDQTRQVDGGGKTCLGRFDTRGYKEMGCWASTILLGWQGGRTSSMWAERLSQGWLKALSRWTYHSGAECGLLVMNEWANACPGQHKANNGTRALCGSSCEDLIPGAGRM